MDQQGGKIKLFPRGGEKKGPHVKNSHAKRIWNHGNGTKESREAFTCAAAGSKTILLSLEGKIKGGGRSGKGGGEAP